MLLSELETGGTAKIKRLKNSEKMRKRLINMGLTEGVSVTLIRKSPFGDPLEIKVRDFCLALRVSEAAKIEVFAFNDKNAEKSLSAVKKG